MSIIVAFAVGVFVGSTMGICIAVLFIGAHDCDAVQG
jgi:hypothetical protein